MCGSGTVVRTATDLGLRAVGFDLDPLALLMTRVWCSSLDAARLEMAVEQVLREFRKRRYTPHLSWIDEDEETSRFAEFWFAERQANDLRRLVSIVADQPRDMRDALRLAISRIVITKDRGALLARDVSHSRPHRVRAENDFDVARGFDRAARQIAMALDRDSPPKHGAHVAMADARHVPLADRSVSAVVTSPPYLNAIDYIRGHRLALIWLGFSVARLREIRSRNIGVERGLKSADAVQALLEERLGDRFIQLPPSIRGWIREVHPRH